MKFIANSDYEENNTQAIHLKAGQEITSGPADKTWPGWVWATDSFERKGYVPADILEPLGEDRWAAIEDFDPTVLKVKKGDELKSLKQVHGWHWCENQSQAQGWVADYLLKPAQS